MKKRLLVEISSMSDSTLSKSGVTNYIEGLLGGLLKIDMSNSYTLAGFVGNQEYYDTDHPPFVASNSIYHPIRIFSRQTYIRLLKFGVSLPFDKLVPGRYEVALFPNFVAWPVASRKIKVFTVIHDLSFEKYPEHVDPGNGRYLRRFVKRTCNDSGHLIAISESTKKDLIAIHGVDPSRVSVVPPAVDYKHFTKSSPTLITAAKKRYGIPGDYILFVGNVEPRKNLVRVLDAYSKLPKKVRANNSLVLAGSAGWNDEAIQSKIADLAKAGTPVIKTGFIVAEDLPHVYSGASLFIFPSLYEGFGIPVLEAMACGVPVITSNVSSLPEVAGKAALLVDPLDTHEISASIAKVLTNGALRRQMIADGYQQIKKYTWDVSAQVLYDLISEAK